MNPTYISPSRQRANAAAAADPFRALDYRLAPDFSQPRLKIPAKTEDKMQMRLVHLYGRTEGPNIYKELERILIVHHAHMTPELIEAEKNFNVAERFTEKDVILITYGDLIISKDKTPLAALADFTQRMFKGLITTLHILPFYPYSSDRGFAVINYQQVDPRLGSWEDIQEIGKSFRLMFDGVINHCSSQCQWFRRYISGDPDYADYFIAFDSPDELDAKSLQKILRPRTSGLLTRFETINGAKYVWTTFSEDQVDLNFKNPCVLMKIIRILLDYVRRGADIIRLDAITYLWRELGTSCAHLEQTHEVVKLLRDVLNTVAPHVALITETNVPHTDNITYFGNGRDEAQMVYNFALPPLVLHTLLTGNSEALSRWAKNLVAPSNTTTFFNFLDSHDGIGILGAKGILTEEQITDLCKSVEQRGGFVSMKSNGDGSESPYELNTTWFSAINPSTDDEPTVQKVDRFIASRAIALALQGVPGIYILSMFASSNDIDAVSRDGVKRNINRSALYEDRIIDIFMERGSIERRITDRFMDLLAIRTNEPAFHPNGAQKILDLGNDVFALIRTSPDDTSRILSLINVTSHKITVKIPLADIGLKGELYDLIREEAVFPNSDIWSVELAPYRVAWFKKSG
ncbi:MAG: sugar phosphorylase [Lentisphaerae bacterium]|nr:sugar phosphorylase [Lentisphaerota bacterium]